MKKLFLIFAICFMSMAAVHAEAIPYRAEGKSYDMETVAKDRGESYASIRRFYIGGDFAYSFWDDDSGLSGDSAGSWDAMIGIRPYDIFRIEANYHRIAGKWDNLDLDADAVFINAIIDARIDGPYQFFRKQWFVPYVGAGAGIAFTDGDNAFTAAALAGIAIEFNKSFALDFGYRYLWIDLPDDDFSPMAHQFRAGVRVSF